MAVYDRHMTVYDGKGASLNYHFQVIRAVVISIRPVILVILAFVLGT